MGAAAHKLERGGGVAGEWFVESGGLFCCGQGYDCGGENGLRGNN